jgi:hypothetical protein
MATGDGDSDMDAADQVADAAGPTGEAGEPDDAEAQSDRQALIVATGLGVDGEHGPLFSGVDLELGPGLHAIQASGGWGQMALLLTLAGRLKRSHGALTVCGDSTPRTIRKHCAIAAFDDIDDLEETVSVQTIVAEQRRWLSPWYAQVPIEAGESELVRVFGDLTPPSRHTYISELSDLEQFLLRVTLALFSNRPILVVGDLEQVRDMSRRAVAVQRLAAIAAAGRTVVVGVSNPLGSDAPEHHLHDHRILTGRD